MAKELIYQGDSSETIDAVLRNALDGKVCRISNKIFEDWGSGSRTRADYAIALVMDDGLLAAGDMPTGIAAGWYFAVYTARDGVNPVDEDSYRGQSEEFYWDGTKIIREVDILSADIEIDTTVTPWNVVVKNKDMGAEILRKALKDTSGGNITNTMTVIGQQVEPE